jgi:hypothetical protein
MLRSLPLGFGNARPVLLVRLAGMTFDVGWPQIAVAIVLRERVGNDVLDLPRFANVDLAETDMALAAVLGEDAGAVFAGEGSA